DAAERLALERQLGHLFRRFDVTAEQDDAAEIELAGERSKLRGDCLTWNAADQELANVAATCQRHDDTENYNCVVRISASAPTRIDLAGGKLDIWPLYLFHP